jgi:hypothetical protein
LVNFSHAKNGGVIFCSVPPRNTIAYYFAKCNGENGKMGKSHNCGVIWKVIQSAKIKEHEKEIDYAYFAVLW